MQTGNKALALAGERGHRSKSELVSGHNQFGEFLDFGTICTDKVIRKKATEAQVKFGGSVSSALDALCLSSGMSYFGYQ